MGADYDTAWVKGTWTILIGYDYLQSSALDTIKKGTE